MPVSQLGDPLLARARWPETLGETEHGEGTLWFWGAGLALFRAVLGWTSNLHGPPIPRSSAVFASPDRWPLITPALFSHRTPPDREKREIIGPMYNVAVEVPNGHPSEWSHHRGR